MAESPRAAKRPCSSNGAYDFKDNEDPLAQSLNSPVIAVLVGAEEKPVYVHEGLLCHYSEFFRRGLQGNFQEADAKKMKLPGKSS